MARFYTCARLVELKTNGGKVFQGVLQYEADNPDYIEDTREPQQRRKTFGKKPNPEYVEDEREPKQRRSKVHKSVRRRFDAEATRAIMADPTAEAPRTKTDAAIVLNEWRKQMEAEHAAPDAALSVGDYVKAYIDGLEKLGTVTKSTLHDYRGTMRYLKYAPAIDAIPLRELTPRQVQAWESGLLARGLSGTTALKAHRLLKQVCKHAVGIDDLPKTPVRGFKAPSRSTGRPNALDAEGRAKAMQVLKTLDPSPVTIAAELALYAGLRRGEICALTWADVDLEGVAWPDTDETGPKLRVSQAFGDAEGGQFIKTPKTIKGRRVVPLGGGIVSTLKQRRAAMLKEWAEAMEKAGIEPTEKTFSTLYVIGYANGDAYLLDKLSKEWKRIADRHALIGTSGHIVTFHDLRHTNATMLITRGVDVSSVSDLLGHEQISTTLNMYTSKDSRAKRHAAMVAASDLDAARTGEVLPFVPRTGTEG